MFPFIIQPTDELDSPFADLTLARRYLHQLAAACAEGANSPDPRVTGLALELVRRPQIRSRRSSEVFALICTHCRREIEIPAQPPFHCPQCATRLLVEWREPNPPREKDHGTTNDPA
jgi:DNA-directed RNA polymerase subunit RPC12/RpoP